MFQVASNFNGIESVSERDGPDQEDYTENYKDDMTQGPAASISAGAAAIVRVHAPFYNESTQSFQWGQDFKQVEFLSGLKEHLPVNNGYVMLTDNLPAWKDLKDDPEKQKGFKLGIQSNAQVVYGHRSHEKLDLVKTEAFINQVFCAALNISQGESGSNNHTIDQKDNFERSKYVLRMDYEGTYLAAHYTGSTELYLTLIGGGAFGNRSEDIANAVVDAHVKYGRGELKKVYCVVFSAYDRTIPIIKAGLKEKNIAFEHREYSKGDPKYKLKIE